MNLKAFVNGLTEQEKTELLNILTELHTDYIEVEDIPQQKLATADNSEDFTMKKSNSNVGNKREAVQARSNTWSDTGEDRHITTPDVPRTPRNRKPPQKKEVTCRACGKKNKINAALIYGEYYRCDSCTS